MRFSRTGLALGAVLAGVGWLAASPVTAQQIDGVLQNEVGTQHAAAGSQKKIDQLADATEDLVREYRDVLDQTERLRRYNAQLEKLIANQEKQLASLLKQIDDVTVIGRDIKPLMAEMVDALENLVQIDVPFRRQERLDRVAFLRSIMDRSDVSDAERFRRILEAYTIEADAGRLIEAYSGPLDLGSGEPRQVDFLSVGRVALIYKTQDNDEVGAWDNETKQWIQLDDDYRGPIRQAFRVARKQSAPDLLRLPIVAPKGGE